MYDNLPPSKPPEGRRHRSSDILHSREHLPFPVLSSLPSFRDPLCDCRRQKEEPIDWVNMWATHENSSIAGLLQPKYPALGSQFHCRMIRCRSIPCRLQRSAKCWVWLIWWALHPRRARHNAPHRRKELRQRIISRFPAPVVVESVSSCSWSSVVIDLRSAGVARCRRTGPPPFLRSRAFPEDFRRKAEHSSPSRQIRYSLFADRCIVLARCPCPGL